MTPAQIKKHAAIFLFLDAQAGHAFVLGDERTMDFYLESRNALGTVIREANHQAWLRLHRGRFVPTPATQPA